MASAELPRRSAGSGDSALPWRSTRAPDPEAAAPAPQTGKTAIAVLPFANLSPEKDQEYFSDGLTEELLNALAKNPKLRVTSPTSAFPSKGKEGDPQDDCGQARCDACLGRERAEGRGPVADHGAVGRGGDRFSPLA